MLYSYVQCSVHPHIPVTSNQGLVRRPMRGQDLWGRLYAEHRSCREVIPLGNFTCKCDLSGWNTVNQRSIHHQFNRTGKLHGSWETLQVFWGRARFHGSTVLFWMALVLNTVCLPALPLQVISNDNVSLKRGLKLASTPRKGWVRYASWDIVPVDSTRMRHWRSSV